jgi:hypothetical protein
MKIFSGMVVLALAVALGGCGTGTGSSGVEVAGESIAGELTAGDSLAGALTQQGWALHGEAPPVEAGSRPALATARAFTAEIAAGNTAGAFDRHFDFDLALDKLFPGAALGAELGEARAKLRDILVWSYQGAGEARGAGAERYRGFAAAGERDGAQLVRYTVAPGGNERAYTEMLELSGSEGAVAISDIQVMSDFWFTEYLRRLHQISGEKPMTFLRGFHAATAAGR